MSEVKLLDRKDVEEKYTWDISLIYKNDEEFRKNLKEQEVVLEQFYKNFEGKLKDLETLDLAIKEYEKILLNYDKLSHYAFLPMTVDRTNEVFIENDTLFNNYNSLFATYTSFF